MNLHLIGGSMHIAAISLCTIEVYPVDTDFMKQFLCLNRVVLVETR